MEPSRQSSNAGMRESERLGTMSLSGDWEGHYSQYGAPHSIRAAITQKGNRLTGVMTDDETDASHSLNEVAFESISPGSDEILDAQLRRMFPGSGSSEVRIQTVLPSRSRLEGTVAGDYVVFKKTYLGEHRIRYLLGDRGLEYILPSHSVRYDGRIIEQGRCAQR